MALTDQQIRDAGILYLSPQKYLLNPFKLPEEEQEGEGGGGGGGGTTPSFSKTFSGGINTLPQSQLMGGFEEALAARQKRLTSPKSL